MRRIILIFLVFTCVIHTGFSQDNDTVRNTWHPSQGALLDGRTILKVNLPGLALGFYGFSAERVIGKHFSLVAMWVIFHPAIFLMLPNSANW